MRPATLVLLFLSISSTGCSPLLNPYLENFKCKAPDEDGKCIDTPAAYAEARKPQSLEATVTLAENQSALPGSRTLSPNPQQTIQDARYKIVAGLLQKPEKPLLQPPKVLRVLLLPYEGKDGELFMSRYAYIQVEKAKWLLTDQHEKKKP